MCEFSFNKPSKSLKMLLQLNCLTDVRSPNLLGLSIRPFHSFHSISSLKTEFAIIWLATPTAFLRPLAFRDHLVHDAPVVNWHPNCMVLIKYVFFSFSRERFTFLVGCVWHYPARSFRDLALNASTQRCSKGFNAVRSRVRARIE